MPNPLDAVSIPAIEATIDLVESEARWCAPEYPRAAQDWNAVRVALILYLRQRREGRQ